MNPLTIKQLGAISHWLHMEHIQDLPERMVERNGMLINMRRLDAEEWMQKNLDVGTASTVISAFRNGNHEFAWRQLIHLGLPVK